MERQRTYNALYIIATFLLLTPFPDDVHTHARAYVINTHRLSPFILVPRRGIASNTCFSEYIFDVSASVTY